jgi:hypothetical protein
LVVDNEKTVYSRYEKRCHQFETKLQQQQQKAMIYSLLKRWCCSTIVVWKMSVLFNKQSNNNSPKLYAKLAGSVWRNKVEKKISGMTDLQNFVHKLASINKYAQLQSSFTEQSD